MFVHLVAPQQVVYQNGQDRFVSKKKTPPKMGSWGYGIGNLPAVLNAAYDKGYPAWIIDNQHAGQSMPPYFWALPRKGHGPEFKITKRSWGTIPHAREAPQCDCDQFFGACLICECGSRLLRGVCRRMQKREFEGKCNSLADSLVFLF